MCLYVREITPAEGRILRNTARRGHDRIKVRRGQVILASAQGSKVPAIAQRLYFSPQHVRTIIKDFNANGFDALAPKYDGAGRRSSARNKAASSSRPACARPICWAGLSADGHWPGFAITLLPNGSLPRSASRRRAMPRNWPGMATYV